MPAPLAKRERRYLGGAVAQYVLTPAGHCVFLSFRQNIVDVNLLSLDRRFVSGVGLELTNALVTHSSPSWQVAARTGVSQT